MYIRDLAVVRILLLDQIILITEHHVVLLVIPNALIPSDVPKLTNRRLQEQCSAQQLKVDAKLTRLKQTTTLESVFWAISQAYKRAQLSFDRCSRDILLHNWKMLCWSCSMLTSARQMLFALC